MKKLILTVCCILLFFFNQAKTNGITKDSANSRIHIHLAVSIKPLINWISTIDSNGSFFSSGALYEPQISYKKHYLMFGFNISNSTRQYTINEIPAEIQKLYYSLNPAYYYNFFSLKRWDALAGVSFMYSKSYTEDRLYTSLETITETTQTIDKGLAPGLRVRYRFKRLFSIETEIAYYIIKSNYSYVKNYPLTPSLQTRSGYNYSNTRGSVPSNILLKITF